MTDYINRPHNYRNLIWDFLVLSSRKRIAKKISNSLKLPLYTNYKVLDVGATADTHFASSNLITKILFSDFSVDAYSNQPSPSDIQPYQRWIVGDARNTKMESKRYPIVFSHATIEHVGSLNDQIEFLSELTRIASALLVITTPNKSFFLEPHTRLPFLHWLDESTWRKILSFIGMRQYATEDILKPLSLKSFKYLAKKLDIENDFDVSWICGGRFFGSPNIILIATRK
jgi:ubiquinone/menaquinone biosynthesis C-methylase UbiE